MEEEREKTIIGEYVIESTKYKDQIWIRTNDKTLHLIIDSENNIKITRWNNLKAGIKHSIL